MNKSIEFILQRIKDQQMDWLPTNYDEAKCLNPLEILPSIDMEQMYSLIKNDNLLEYSIKKEKENQITNVRIIYNPNYDFEYIIVEKTVHDGTLLFSGEAISKLLSRILFIGTYNNQKIKTIEEVSGNIVQYTIGDLVWHTTFKDRVKLQCGEYPGVEEVMILPIAFDLIKS